jgi:excisionase family DNA binding protein
MPVSILDQKPMAPTEQDVIDAAKIAKRLQDLEGESLSIEVKVPGAADETMAVPQIIAGILLMLLVLVANGQAVQVVPIEKEISPNEAADLLNVSRPYVLKLMNEGKLPFIRVGAHRRLLASEVLAYKQKQMAESRAAMQELNALSREMDMGY